ncbi:MAG: methyltransferase domain-containing protein [Steroidobacteraceae bacterium]
MNAAVLSLDVLMERIRDEVARLRSRDGNPRSEGTAKKLESERVGVSGKQAPSEKPSAPIRVHLDLEFPASEVSKVAEATTCGSRYSELTKYDDEAFIQAAYRCVLGREPDFDGISCYLAMLHEGASKAEILGRLCRSTEGKEYGAKIKGLAVPYAIDTVRRWPVIGSVLRLPIALYELSARERKDRRELAVLRNRIASLDSRTERSCVVSQEALRKLEQTLNAAGHRLSASERAARALRCSVHILQREMVGKSDAQSAEARFSDLSDGLRLKADHVTVSSVAQGLETALQRKADCEAVDVFKVAIDAATAAIRDQRAEIDAAIESLRRDKVDTTALNQIHRHLLRSLEMRAERHELSTLSNYITQGLKERARIEEIPPLSAALKVVQEQLIHLRRKKADIAEFERIDMSVDVRMRTVREELQTLRAQATDIPGRLADEIAAIQPRLQELLEPKADRTDLEGLLAKVVAAEIDSKAAQANLNEASIGLRKDLNGLAESLTLETQRVRNDIAKELSSELTAFGESVRALDATKIDRESMDLLKKEVAAVLEAKDGEISSRFRNELMTTNSRTRELKVSYLEQERRLHLLLEEARKRLPEPMSLQQVESLAAEHEHNLAAMYASFEDTFRGTREDIRNRQSIYVERVRRADAGTPKRPLLDIGCGRGEWLELLRDHGLTATGIDVNRVFLDRCRELELDVVEQDALEFLRQRKANSIGALTSFHLIEHLPNWKLVALLDEALRVLRPGGVLILETPNPRNLTVGACSFYLDPTHVRPLPPDYSRFIVEARGFVSVEVEELHPCGADELISDCAPKVTEILNRFFFSARDYAVIGRKA